MSFLNQLKNKPGRSRRGKENTQQLEACAASLQKACDLLLHDLQDLARQLNILQPPTPPFSLDGKVRWPQMKAAEFRVDARRKMLRNEEVCDGVAMGWDIVPQSASPWGAW